MKLNWPIRGSHSHALCKHCNTIWKKSAEWSVVFEKCWFKMKDLSNSSSPKSTPAICFIQFRILWRIAGHLLLLRERTMDSLIPYSLANLKLFLTAYASAKTFIIAIFRDMRFSHANSAHWSQRLLRIHFSLSSIIIMATYSQRTLKNRNKRNGSKSINHNSQTCPFDPVKANFCFLRGPLRFLTAAKTYFVVAVDLSRVRMFLKIAIIFRLSYTSETLPARIKAREKRRKNVCAIASVHGCDWLVLGKGKNNYIISENKVQIK